MAEQWIKEGKHALHWTRLSCHDFADNQVRLQLFILAYNLANFLRTLALPEAVRHWSLTTLQTKLIKIGAKVVRHARYVTFQMGPRWLCRVTSSGRSWRGFTGCGRRRCGCRDDEERSPNRCHTSGTRGGVCANGASRPRNTKIPSHDGRSPPMGPWIPCRSPESVAESSSPDADQGQ